VKDHISINIHFYFAMINFNDAMYLVANEAEVSWQYSYGNSEWRCFTETPILDVVGGSLVDGSTAR
jgi:hypothetical protein